MRIVIDTSSFIRATLERDEMAKECIVATFQAAVRKGINPQPALRVASTFILRANLVMHQSKFHWCADPDDAMFLECAIDGNADIVISNDRSLTAIKEYVTDEHAKSLIRPINF